MPPKNAGLPGELEVYFRLIWLFVIIISVLMVLLCYLYLAMRRAQEQETKSLSFSHLVIAGLEAERRRVTRELHDTVLPEVQGRAVSALIREICADLMPPDFARLSLGDSLAGLCSRFAARTGIECAVKIAEGLDFTGLGAEKQLHLYRVVQEALTNIEKHSGTRRAALLVRAQNHGVLRSALILVSDDGSGLPPGFSADGQAGLGMRTMRQRAAIMGARLDFISESGNGLAVRLEVPLPPV
jgi:two-component system NarL family sensor kinase